ncbi:MAG: DUF5675 family protein [Endomicrobium sp.]|uniref:DUF5675 family protein n=1 Tax=Candidatus Endomicrobiellum pyrsonymphae TaxID=1408203 RepID=UPI003588ECB4|nr:DUF5675 family protein [Endomicrobium sp.]
MICGTLESGKSSRMLMPIGKYKVMVEIQQRITITSKCSGFTGVRIHRGNISKDMQGCILPGKNDRNRIGWVSYSTKYEQKIMDLILSY